MAMTIGEFVRYIGMFMAWLEQQPVLSVFLFFSCVHLFVRVISALISPLPGAVSDIADEQPDTGYDWCPGGCDWDEDITENDN